MFLLYPNLETSLFLFFYIYRMTFTWMKELGKLKEKFKISKQNWEQEHESEEVESLY